MNRRIFFKRFKRICLISLILGFLFLHFYVPRFITEIKNPLISLLKGGSNHSTISYSTFDLDNQMGKEIDFISFDGTPLSGYLTYSKLDTVKATIILLHGIRSNKEHFIELSKMLSLQGFNSFALDLRAHGKSEGKHCTFGVKEKQDISALLHVLNRKENITENIGVWGQSLGGAVALQSLGFDKRLSFGIVESTFSDFGEITHDYFKYHVGFNMEFFTNYLVYRAGVIAEFETNDAKPVKYCKNIDQPILIVHGSEDKRIDIKYGKENYDVIPSLNKEFLEIKGANHLNVWEIGNEAYFNRVIEFIKKI